MPKAVMVSIYEHSGDSDTVAAFITFRFLGAGFNYGTIDTSISIISTDTAATITTKIQNAVIARAAEYGVSLTNSDLIPLLYGVPESLVTSANSSTFTVSDDGVNQSVYGSLGNIRLGPGAATPFTQWETGQITNGFANGGYLFDIEYSQFGTNDVLLQGLPATSAGYTALEAYNSAGLILGTGGNANPVKFQVNRVQVASIDSNGFTTVGGVQVKSVAKQTYSTTNHSDDRTYNETSTTVTELAHVLGTLLNDMRAIGLVA